MTTKPKRSSSPTSFLLRALLLLCLALACAAGVACGTEEEPLPLDASDTDGATDPSNLEEFETHADAVYAYDLPTLSVTDDFSYADDAQKQSWRASLVELLAAQHARSYTVEVDPDAEHAENRYHFVEGSVGAALLDVTGDGIPEVAVRYPGGSAGNSFYELYDLFTKEEIGSLSTGWTEDSALGTWAIYRDGTGNCKPFGTYNYRIGWAETDTFYSTVEQSASGWNTHVLYHALYTLEGDMTVGVTDRGYTFYEGSRQIDRAAFETALAALAASYTKLDGTDMVSIDWSELDGYSKDASQQLLAEQMADALLKTAQRFPLREADKP